MRCLPTNSRSGGDVSPGDQASGDLIEQWLEQVEISFVDQGDPHIGFGQCLARVNAGKTSNDHDMGCMLEAFLWWFQFQEEMLAGHGSNGINTRRVWIVFVFVR